LRDVGLCNLVEAKKEGRRMVGMGQKILERLEALVGDLVRERVEVLAGCLEEVLSAWSYESRQADGIMEGNVEVYRKARQELCAVRGWGYDPMRIPKVRPSDPPPASGEEPVITLWGDPKTGWWHWTIFVGVRVLASGYHAVMLTAVRHAKMRWGCEFNTEPVFALREGW
jgi:hypothetical protein